MKSPRVLVLDGANLNLLGKREVSIYGARTLAQIHRAVRDLAAELGLRVTTFQSNHEGDLVDRILASPGRFEGLLINPGSFTHTSVALRDAVLASALPAIEVHISNIYAREEFRHHSYLAGVARGQITGLGVNSYLLGLRALKDLLAPARAR
jgi:3-dehydroquinate dehydratase-2